MHRRDFLRASAAASSTLIGNAMLGCATIPITGRDESVVVIGAGMAGISAARELQTAGYRVTVLEAARRIGGRIYTNRDLGLPIELGASRVHGTRNNPIIDYLKQTGVGYIEVDWDQLAGSETDGTPLDERELARVRGRILGVFRRAYLRYLGSNQDFPIEVIVQQELARRELTRTERRLFFFGIVSAEMTNASPFSEASWKYALEYEAFPGGDHFIVNGYDTVVNMLAKELDIKTGVAVKRIDYRSGPVRVITEDGELQADRVVVTVPLGVLRAGDFAFTPELPVDKRAVIDRIGMGLINKIAIRFPKVFWPVHVHALVHGTDIRGEYPAFVNVARYAGEPVLVAYVPGTYENGLEDMPDSDAVGGAVEVLRRMYGSSVPDPVGAVRTRWGAYPFTHGAFSFNKVGATGRDRDVLALPVADRIFFAGEATSRRKFGSVSGAYLSGLRAAREIATLPVPLLA